MKLWAELSQWWGSYARMFDSKWDQQGRWRGFKRKVQNWLSKEMLETCDFRSQTDLSCRHWMWTNLLMKISSRREVVVTIALHITLISFCVLALGVGYHCLLVIGSKTEWGMRHSNTYAVFRVTLNNSGPASSVKLLESFSLTGTNVMLARLGQLKSAGSVAA